MVYWLGGLAERRVVAVVAADPIDLVEGPIGNSRLVGGTAVEGTGRQSTVLDLGVGIAEEDIDWQ